VTANSRKGKIPQKVCSDPILKCLNEIAASIFYSFARSPYSVQFGDIYEIRLITIVNEFLLRLFQSRLDVFREHVTILLMLQRI
jgi:hypothetical protein